MALLEIENLTVEFATAGGAFRAVDGLSLSVDAGDVLAVVGESGSGKSVAMLAMMGLLPWTAKVTADRMTFDGADLLSLTPRARRQVIGKDIAMIFQEPMSSLNPCFTVGFQLGEALKVHMGLDRAARRARSIELLDLVGIPAPEKRLGAFPHQLSGGMSQRVMIAMAISCNPKLLIADEPTTALDVTIQAQILELMKELQDEMGMSIILITHDLGVIAETCDDVLVMYAGRVAEQGSAEDIFHRPAHPYTRGLLDSIPRLEYPRKTKLKTIDGMVPGLMDMPAGCRFNNRCQYRVERCTATAPAVEPLAGAHGVSCHRWRELPAWKEPVS
jgi:dipeptide transport system ATP-binding protein